MPESDVPGGKLAVSFGVSTGVVVADWDDTVEALESAGRCIATPAVAEAIVSSPTVRTATNVRVMVDAKTGYGTSKQRY